MALSRSVENKLFITGYTAKGIVYCLIGGFAVATVIGAASGGTNGPKAVIGWIGTNPFGQVLLFLIGLGLLAYCAWRWYTAVQDKKNEGSDKEGVVKRIAYAVSGTAYGVLSAHAFKLAFGGGGGGGGGQSKQDIIARILSNSWGPYVVGLIGAIMAGVALYQLYRAVTNKHMEGIEGQQLSHDQQETFKVTGEVGLTARSIVYGIIAYFLFRAALMDDPGQFRGIGEALSLIEDQSYGAALLAIVGAGLLAYGIFMFVRAKYERV